MCFIIASTKLFFEPVGSHQNHPFSETGAAAPVSLNGGPGRIRTSDHLIRSQVLYPAELRVRIVNL